MTLQTKAVLTGMQPPRAFDLQPDQEDLVETGIGFSLGQFFQALRRAKNLIVTTMLLGAVLAGVYATVLRHPVYVASAVVGPIESGSSSGSVRQSVAAIAGVDLSGMSSGNFNKFTQILHSARLAETLQNKYGLMGVAFPGTWNAETHEWVRPSGPIGHAKEAIKELLGMPPWSPPNSARFASYLTTAIEIKRVGGLNPLDIRNQTTVISTKMDSHDMAVRFLVLAIQEADEICRQDQLANSQRRVDYLNSMIANTQEIYLKQSLQQLLMIEEQTLLTVKVNRYYSVDMMDPPNADTKPAGASVTGIIISGAVAGFVVGIVLVFLLFRRRLIVAAEAGSDPLAMPFPNPVGATAQWIGARLARRPVG